MDVHKYMFKVNNGNTRERHGTLIVFKTSTVKIKKVYIIDIILVFFSSIPKNITTPSIVSIPDLEQVNLSWNP